jgi:hypothetical protein
MVQVKSQKQWKQWCTDGHRPANLPSLQTGRTRTRGRTGWADLGYGEGLAPLGTFLPLEEARELVRELGLTSHKQ